MNTLRLAIADDHSLLLEGLASMFQADPLIELVAVTDNGETMLEHIPDTKPDIILLDITMPGRGGESIAAEILRRYPDIRIIMLTMHQTPEYVLPLVDLGVHGFILKNATNAELRAAIHLVHQGKKYYSDEVVQVISRRNIREEQEEIQVTRREREVLQLLYEGHSTQDMAEKLFISQFTVFKHRQNLLQKCGCKNANQLINLAISKGWVVLKNN